jgi:hypothetical protein
MIRIWQISYILFIACFVVKILQIWTYDSRHRIKVELDDILMMSSFNNVPATYPRISMQSLLTAKFVDHQQRIH